VTRYGSGRIHHHPVPLGGIRQAGGEKLIELPLSVHKQISPSCGAAHDRDLNAAINLKNMAVSSTVSACSEEGAGRARISAVKPAAMKQEASRRFSEE
jgi:putative transposase